MDDLWILTRLDVNFEPGHEAEARASGRAWLARNGIRGAGRGWKYDGDSPFIRWDIPYGARSELYEIRSRPLENPAGRLVEIRYTGVPTIRWVLVPDERAARGAPTKRAYALMQGFRQVIERAGFTLSRRAERRDEGVLYQLSGAGEASLLPPGWRRG